MLWQCNFSFDEREETIYVKGEPRKTKKQNLDVNLIWIWFFPSRFFMSYWIGTFWFFFAFEREKNTPKIEWENVNYSNGFNHAKNLSTQRYVYIFVFKHKHIYFACSSTIRLAYFGIKIQTAFPPPEHIWICMSGDQMRISDTNRMNRIDRNMNCESKERDLPVAIYSLTALSRMLESDLKATVKKMLPLEMFKLIS